MRPQTNRRGCSGIMATDATYLIFIFFGTYSYRLWTWQHPRPEKRTWGSRNYVVVISMMQPLHSSFLGSKSLLSNRFRLRSNWKWSIWHYVNATLNEFIASRLASPVATMDRNRIFSLFRLRLHHCHHRGCCGGMRTCRFCINNRCDRDCQYDKWFESVGVPASGEAKEGRAGTDVGEEEWYKEERSLSEFTW